MRFLAQAPKRKSRQQTSPLQLRILGLDCSWCSTAAGGDQEWVEVGDNKTSMMNV